MMNWNDLQNLLSKPGPASGGLLPRMLAITSLASMVLVSQGCLTVGDDFTSEVTWIQRDKTTRQEIESKVGQPFRVGYDTGLLTFTYGFYRYSVFRPTRTKDLTVRFNKDGTVNSYSFASSFDEDKSSMAK
ncbi:MAG: hypothetical protein IOD12_02980 [Silvanigrellales bacterium]|jgi:hypothetical protein|nr:hypothetical protein [Silvanigrellales bacterium]